jgi:CheY-like chemotaxis protein
MLDTDTNPASKRPVLVVEDDVLVRIMVADELRENGLAVIECGDADEALDVLHSGTQVSLVVTDVRMPGSMDGAELATLIKRDFPTLKVILTSSEAPPSGAQFDLFVPKPWDLPKVVQRIRAIAGS